MNPLILASASPRRKHLLQQLGLSPQIVVADIDETPFVGEAADDYVLRLAEEKSSTVSADFLQAVTLAADTIIALDGNLLGKPQSKEEAFSMWEQMSGREHQVLTAIAVQSDGKCDLALNINQVMFAAISRPAMERYWSTGEPQDKAGAYAIQGLAACWIKQIQGSYSGIMGLPLYETAMLLKQHGVQTLL